MSWDTINIILLLATVDESFCSDLLKNPLSAIKERKLEITPNEQDVLKQIAAHNLTEFSQQVLLKLKP